MKACVFPCASDLVRELEKGQSTLLMYSTLEPYEATNAALSLFL